jgi:hypothetical protein
VPRSTGELRQAIVFKFEIHHPAFETDNGFVQLLVAEDSMGSFARETRSEGRAVRSAAPGGWSHSEGGLLRY